MPSNNENSRTHLHNWDGSWVPVGYSYGDSILPVTTNWGQRPTYFVARGPSSGSAPTAPSGAGANIDKVLLVGWHPSTSGHNVQILRVGVSALLGTAVTYLYSVYRAAIAPAGGTTVSSRPADAADAASDMTWMYTSTNAIGTQAINGSFCDHAVISTVGGHNEVVLYEWEPSGDMKPIILAPNVGDGIVVTSRATTNTAPDAIITVTYTERAF
jgi:hypothetical protein